MSLEGSDPVGRFAASLALTQLDEVSATEFAIRHHLCTHLTSLVLVDEESATQEELPQMRKVPLEISASMAARPIHVSPMVNADAQVSMCIARNSDSQASTSGGNALFRKASAVDNRGDESEAMWKAILVAFEEGAPTPALSASLERKVRELEVHDSVIEIADASHIESRIIALALVAVSLKAVPHATRFYHRVMMKLAHDQGVEFMTFWRNHLRET